MSTERPVFSTRLDPDLLARVRAATRGIQAVGHPDFTLTQLTEDALRSWADYLEATYNDGDPWDQQQNPLRPGRRTTAT